MSSFRAIKIGGNSELLEPLLEMLEEAQIVLQYQVGYENENDFIIFGGEKEYVNQLLSLVHKHFPHSLRIERVPGFFTSNNNNTSRNYSNNNNNNNNRSRNHSNSNNFDIRNAQNRNFDFRLRNILTNQNEALEKENEALRQQNEALREQKKIDKQQLEIYKQRVRQLESDQFSC